MKAELITGFARACAILLSRDNEDVPTFLPEEPS